MAISILAVAGSTVWMEWVGGSPVTPQWSEAWRNDLAEVRWTCKHAGQDGSTSREITVIEKGFNLNVEAKTLLEGQ